MEEKLIWAGNGQPGCSQSFPVKQCSLEDPLHVPDAHV